MNPDLSPLEALEAERRSEWQKQLAERIYERAIAASIIHDLSADNAHWIAQAADLAAEIWCLKQERK